MTETQRIANAKRLLWNYFVFSVLYFLLFTPQPLQAQSKNGSAAGTKRILITAVPGEKKFTITADGQPFTEFQFPDTLEKPVLYPIYAPDGQLVTRGFPIAPRPGEPTDHPHHLGLWFNYESVNGLDFWNNSFAIPADKKSQYGWIRTKGVPEIRNGRKGTLKYSADWTDQRKNVLMKETTSLVFSAREGERIIDRITTLTAVQDIHMPDAKDGMLGLRVTRELQIPAGGPLRYTDNKGNVTTVTATADTLVNGNYLTSEGKQGDSAWATRGVWCLLYGRKKEDMLSIAIIDHPSNPGYPTYWHARGYGLFAANPLGQKIFSKGMETLDFRLKKGASVTFRYRIVIAAGPDRLSTDRIGQLAAGFAREK